MVTHDLGGIYRYEYLKIMGYLLRLMPLLSLLMPPQTLLHQQVV